MKQLLTEGIILSRIEYGEADRIITVLTPEHGKLRLMARGVRRIKSKLAGGIELFSVSDLSYIKGKGEIGTLVSSRLKTHYGSIVQDLSRVQLGYELIKLINKATEDQPDEEYFNLLRESFKALDDKAIPKELISIWFKAQLLAYGGHMPNLSTDIEEKKLEEKRRYSFNFDNMCFVSHPEGTYDDKHIRVLRLLFSNNLPGKINRVNGLKDALDSVSKVINEAFYNYGHGHKAIA